MQQASIMLNIGGDSRNQVPKHHVTPSEVAILRMIHGDDAVSEVAIYPDEVKRSSKVERERLHEIYAKGTPNGERRCLPLDQLFPGVAARLYQSFEEMELEEHFFKAGHAPARETIEEDEEETSATQGNAGGEQEDADDIDDMNDGHAGEVGGEGEETEQDETGKDSGNGSEDENLFN